MISPSYLARRAAWEQQKPQAQAGVIIGGCRPRFIESDEFGVCPPLPKPVRIRDVPGIGMIRFSE